MTYGQCEVCGNYDYLDGEALCFKCGASDGETAGSRDVRAEFFIPTRAFVESLEVGDLAPWSGSGLRPVVEICFKGYDLKGRAYVGYYVRLGTGSRISSTLKEDRLHLRAGLSVSNSAELKRIERDFLEHERAMLELTDRMAERYILGRDARKGAI